MKRKDSKDMLALREVVELEKRSFAEKLYYKWILYFKQVLASVLVKLILDRFAPILSQSPVLSITSHIHIFTSFP
jgi:hypothetical protein